LNPAIVIEKNIEIANRIPPGDRWQVIGVEGIQNGLTDALEAYYALKDEV
jgi:hypothetical protein